MLHRPHLASGGSSAFARPLGTVRTLYTDILSLSRGLSGNREKSLRVHFREGSPASADAGGRSVTIEVRSLV